MPAMFNASTRPAMFAGRDCGKRMPFFMHGACMATTAGIIILGTGVLAPVSLVARTLSLILALVLLSVLLTLIGLTGLGSLVGLNTERHLSAAQGD